MRVYQNELVVHRNETFTIDKIVMARDGAPFVISSRLDNPYICITIASSRYDQEGKYEHTWWLDLNKGYNDKGEFITLPRFNSTSPMHLTSDDWSIPIPIDLSTGERYDELEAIWYVNLPDGTKQYRKWNAIKGEWEEYDFRIIKTFSQEDSAELIEQNYLYSITLVAGKSVYEYLTDLKLHTFMKIHNIIDFDVFLNKNSSNYNIKLAYEWEIIPSDVNGMYDWLHLHTCVDYIDITSPIHKYTSVQTILEPTKMTVLSNLRGGL